MSYEGSRPEQAPALEDEGQRPSLAEARSTEAEGEEVKTHALVGNKEWGRKARKDEDRTRGLNNRDRREAITEQISDADDLPDSQPCETCREYH